MSRAAATRILSAEGICAKVAMTVRRSSVSKLRSRSGLSRIAALGTSTSVALLRYVGV
jgi:hypothetical protein